MTTLNASLSLLLAKLQLLLISVALTQATYTIQPTSTAMPPVAQISPSAGFLDPKAYVSQEALNYGINPDLALCIITHESQWDGSRIGDVGNLHGESYGWWQIELRAHPDVTKDDAFSLTSSTDWALGKIRDGDVDMWSVYAQPPYYCKNIPVYN